MNLRFLPFGLLFFACTTTGQVAVHSVANHMAAPQNVDATVGLRICLVVNNESKPSYVGDSNWAGDSWKLRVDWRGQTAESRAALKQIEAVDIFKQLPQPGFYDLCIVPTVQLSLDAGTFSHDCKATVTLKGYGRFGNEIASSSVKRSGSAPAKPGAVLACQSAVNLASQAVAQQFFASLTNRQILIRVASSASSRRVIPSIIRIPSGQAVFGCQPQKNAMCDMQKDPLSWTAELPAFAIDLTEVSVEDYSECIQAGTCTAPLVGGACNYGWRGHELYPVNCVNWEQAKMYCQWKGKRLPNPQEWERAARGSFGRRWPWMFPRAKVPANLAQSKNRFLETMPIGSFPSGITPNGIYDLIGNVSEWVEDGSMAEDDAQEHLTMGGSYRTRLRDAKPWRHSKKSLAADVGFRCAVTTSSLQAPTTATGLNR